MREKEMFEKLKKLLDVNVEAGLISRISADWVLEGMRLEMGLEKE